MWNKKTLFHRKCSKEDGICHTQGLEGVRRVPELGRNWLQWEKPLSNSLAYAGTIKINATVWFRRFLMPLSWFIHKGVVFLSSFHSTVFLGVSLLAPEKNFFLSIQFLDLKLLMLHNTPDNPLLCFHLMSSFPRINTGALRVWDKDVFSEQPSQWKPESGYLRVSHTETCDMHRHRTDKHTQYLKQLNNIIYRFVKCTSTVTGNAAQWKLITGAITCYFCC